MIFTRSYRSIGELGILFVTNDMTVTSVSEFLFSFSQKHIAQCSQISGCLDVSKYKGICLNIMYSLHVTLP